jgi:hypothetical protein
MRRLRLAAHDQEGAIAVLVAVLLSGGVLLGMGALVIDVGTIAVEREQLQTRADSIAWGVAASCALGPYSSDDGQACTAPQPAAFRYAGDGAQADATACSTGCGNTAALAQCPSPPTGVQGGIAQARASTLGQDGGTLLPAYFAQSFGYAGTHVVTCSQVVWGVATEGIARGFVVGLCKWQDNYDVAVPATADITLDSARSCAGGVPEFSWLGGDDCESVVEVGGDAPAAANETACPQRLSDLPENTAILVPVVSSVAPGGGFHIVGLAGFVVSQFRSAPDPGEFGALPVVDCAADSACVRGHFTRVVVPTPSTLPGSTGDYGAVALSRIG